MTVQMTSDRNKKQATSATRFFFVFLPMSSNGHKVNYQQFIKPLYSNLQGGYGV